MDVRPPFAVEGRNLFAVTHLALLGVKKIGTGILGTYYLLVFNPAMPGFLLFTGLTNFEVYFRLFDNKIYKPYCIPFILYLTLREIVALEEL